MSRRGALTTELLDFRPGGIRTRDLPLTRLTPTSGVPEMPGGVEPAGRVCGEGGIRTRGAPVAGRLLYQAELHPHDTDVLPLPAAIRTGRAPLRFTQVL
jgi:hypothetical protein